MYCDTSVQVVQFRKNAKCLGATTVEDIYKAVEKLEGNQFADESSNITFTVDTRTHCHSAKKNVSWKQRRLNPRKKVRSGGKSSSRKLRNSLTTVTKGRISTQTLSDWTGRLLVPSFSSTWASQNPRRKNNIEPSGTSGFATSSSKRRRDVLRKGYHRPEVFHPW